MTTQTQSDKHDMLQAALAFAASGCSVVPTRMDGSKAPIGSWKQYQTERANALQLAAWYQDGTNTGIGIVTGSVSGNLELLELEGRAVASGMLDEIREIAVNSGLGEIWNTINNGYVELTPSGGLHWLYRINDQSVPGNTKLARRPGENGAIDVLAETRGTGGYVIVAPSHGSVHPSGQPWVQLRGSPALIPTLSWQEREALHLIFRAFDSLPSVETLREAIQPKADGSISPGDDFSARASWDDILIPRGWVKIYTANGTTYWRRPGKDTGISATTGRNDGDNLYVFTTSTEFDAERPYSKFAAKTILEFNGDFSACARELRRQGYGSLAAVVDTSPIAQAQGQVANADFGDGERVEHKTLEEREFEYQLTKSRIARQVKRALDIEDAIKTYDRFDFIKNLTDELKMPEEAIDWVIPHLMPTGSNVTVTAQYKAGKTTLVNNLAKALADGTKFLNYFAPTNHQGRIVIFNYEVSDHQYRRWMKDVAIDNSAKVTLVHLRGKAVPMVADFVRNEVVAILKDLDCQTWILDPFARAFTGSGDENSNSDVGVFLDQLDIIKERANVANLVLPVHTGRAQESGIDRARGATRIDDWADVRWILKKTEDGRFFSADGRDVYIEEQMLKFDESTRHLTLGGADAKTAKKRNLEDLWVETVTANPGQNTGALCQILGKSTDDKSLAAARKAALYYKRVKSVGVGSATLWYPMSSYPSVQMDAFTA